MELLLENYLHYLDSTEPQGVVFSDGFPAFLYGADPEEEVLAVLEEEGVA